MLKPIFFMHSLCASMCVVQFSSPCSIMLQVIKTVVQISLISMATRRLCWMNTIQYLPKAVRCMQQVFPLGPSQSSMQTASWSLQPFLPGSLCDRPTDRPTDHATWSITINGAHNGEAKFYYCLCLQQVFIEAIDSTDRINFSNQ